MKGTVELKKTSHRTLLDRIFPEIPGKYQKAKWTETLAVTKAKTQLWEKFGEAMEQNI